MPSVSPSVAENFIEWRQVEYEEGLSDDNALVRYLPKTLGVMDMPRQENAVDPQRTSTG